MSFCYNKQHYIIEIVNDILSNKINMSIKHLRVCECIIDDEIFVSFAFNQYHPSNSHNLYVLGYFLCNPFEHIPKMVSIMGI